MRTVSSAILCVALLAVGCGGGSDGQGNMQTTNQAVPASATPESPSPTLASSPQDAAGATTSDPEVNVYKATPGGVTKLFKQGDSLFLTGSSGLVMLTGAQANRLVSEPISAAIYFANRLWLASEGALATYDGVVKIVPEFATAFTSLAVYKDELYVGTAGNGVWKLAQGKLVPVSKDWNVRDLASTEFGLFAATERGLFSYRDDRWHERRVNDTSVALDQPRVLYSRYPYLYVGTDSGVFRHDGGGWDEFSLSAPASALGWHDAKLYIGTTAGSLFTLNNNEIATDVMPGSGAITSIVRFDGRLHLAGELGVFRLRHGRFEKVEWDKPESEPKHEPIAFLL